MQLDRPTKALLSIISCREHGAPMQCVELSERDWHALARAAVRHGVAPLVHARLSTAADKSGARSDIPASVLELLNGYFFRTGLENLRLYAHLASVLRALAEQGIDVIVLKGALLAETVYEDRALRSMGDADLLVRRADLVQVDQMLRRLGWDQRVADDPTAPRLAGGHQLHTFMRGGVRIEVHWNIEDDESPFSIDVEGLWQRARPAQVAGVSALALAPEDLLLHLCLHASYNHGWLQFEAGLRPLIDIGATLTHFAHQLDWDVFIQRALNWKVQRCTLLTLILAKDLVEANLPDRVTNALTPEPVDHAVIDGAARLVLTNYYAEVTRALPTLGRRWLIKRRQNLSKHERLRQAIWPNTDTLRAAYPSLHSAPLLPYLIYWVDLMRDALQVSLAREGRRLSSSERTRLTLASWLEAPAARAGFGPLHVQSTSR